MSDHVKRSIAHVMQESESEYNVTHYLFDQAMLTPEGRYKFDPGVCHALCKVWLKKADTLLPRDFSSYVNQNKKFIIIKQTRAEIRRYASKRLTDPTSVSIHTLECRKEGHKFWEDCAYAMTPSPFANERRIIRLTCGGDDDHSVASLCDHQQRYWFFDPNGGFMDFGVGDDARDSMQDWLENELQKATTNHYDNLQNVVVEKFYPKGTAGPDTI